MSAAPTTPRCTRRASAGSTQAASFYVTLSTKASREHADRWATASRYAAGETSTAIRSIAYTAIATVANTPGAHILLLAMIVFNAISTIVTTRNPTGDYGTVWAAIVGPVAEAGWS